MPFLIALAFGVVLTPLAGRLGRMLGLVDQPGELKIHGAAIPVLGGLAVITAALGSVALLDRWLPMSVVGGIALALATGVLDDMRPLPPWARINLQAAAGLLVALAVPLGPLGVAGVVFVTVATANAVNMLDGQDGLAGGLGVIAASGLAGLAVVLGAPGVAIGLALAGSLLAFLVWNRPPARIFLGNGGAYAVGVVLAALAASVSRAGGWRGIAAAGICLGVLVFELCFSVSRRVFSGKGVTGGDRDHSYDLLAARAGRARSTVLVWIAGAAAGGLAFGVSLAPPGIAIGLVAFCALSGLAIGVWFWRASQVRRIGHRTYGDRVVRLEQAATTMDPGRES